MGKSKNHKRKVNVFKVSSGRSAKAKNKMKSPDVDRLKNVSAQNKQKIESIDQQLFALNEEIRQVPLQKNENNRNSQVTSSSSKIQEVERYKVAQENCEQALERLNSFKM